MADLANHYLTHKQRQLDAGEITARTFRDAHTAAGRALTAFAMFSLKDPSLLAFDARRREGNL
jgi:voltage-gated potassium channel Kch